MSDLLRTTVFGELVRTITKRKVFPFPEERDDFEIPECYQASASPSARPVSPSRSSSATAVDISASLPPKGSDSALEKHQKDPETAANDDANAQALKDTEPPAEKAKQDLEKGSPPTETPEPSPQEIARARGYVLIDWYGDDDQENPQNWPMRRKVFVAGVVSFLTFAVYIAAAIITPGDDSIAAYFGVSDEAVALTLALYVVAYGTGPLLWSPLSEIPSLGRNAFYIYPYFIVFCLQIGLPLTPTFGGLLVLRFLTGFLASPALATGGASLQDIFPPEQIPYAFIGWTLSAVCGPAIGPTISTYAVARFDWRWTMWIQLIITGLAFLAIFFFLPETSGPTILLHRAQRLRHLTGNKKLRSQSEIDQADMDIKSKLIDAMIKPFEIAVKDPAILFTDLYVFLIYATYYLFFTSFPITLEGIYGWDNNANSLAFLTLVIFISFAAFLYCLYYYFVGSKLPFDKPERRLDVALVACLLQPIGLFIHAWTSRNGVSPYVGLFGIGLFGMGVYVIFQTLLFYIGLTYPKYAASIFAGNDFARSTGTAGIIMAGLPFYKNLGVPVADSILGGISCAFVPLMYFLWYKGDMLRARSKFAE